MQATDTLLDERALSKLHWCCRHGLLENDLLIEKLFTSGKPIKTKSVEKSSLSQTGCATIGGMGFPVRH